MGQGGPMINRIMKIGVAAVALAASALLAPTATAQNGFRSDRSVSAEQLRGGPSILRDRSDFRRNRGNRRDRRDRRNRGFDRIDHHSPRLNAYGQTIRQAKILADEAAYACVCQLELDGHKYGFEDAEFRGTPYIEQVGPRAFIVKGTAKLYDGYNYTRQHYECGVRRGQIRRATNLTPANYASYRSRRRGNSFGGFSFSFGSRY